MNSKLCGWSCCSPRVLHLEQAQALKTLWKIFPGTGSCWLGQCSLGELVPYLINPYFKGPLIFGGAQNLPNTSCTFQNGLLGECYPWKSLWESWL